MLEPTQSISEKPLEPVSASNEDSFEAFCAFLGADTPEDCERVIDKILETPAESC